MLKTPTRLIALAGVAGLVALVAPASAQVAEPAARPCDITVTDLPADAQYQAINNRGEVPRLSELQHLPNTRHPSVADINDAGVVVGSMTNRDDNRSFAVVWDEQGVPTQLPFLPNGSPHAHAFGINNDGTIVGDAFGPPRPTPWNPNHVMPAFSAAVKWTRAPDGRYEITQLSSHPVDHWSGEMAAATGINNAGQVVGTLFDIRSGQIHGFTWDEQGNMTELIPLQGGTIEDVTGINIRGQIAGYGTTSTGALHAVVWRPTASGEYNTPYDLGVLPGGRFSKTNGVGGGINDRGQIVGWGDDAASKHNGILWTPAPDGGYTATKLPPLPPFNSSYGEDINNQGQVSGRYSGGGNQKPVLWDTKC